MGEVVAQMGCADEIFGRKRKKQLKTLLKTQYLFLSEFLKAQYLHIFSFVSEFSTVKK